MVRDFLAGCLVLSLGIILAYHFFLFWTCGKVLIGEDSSVVLVLESILSLVIVGFGVERMTK